MWKRLLLRICEVPGEALVVSQAGYIAMLSPTRIDARAIISAELSAATGRDPTIPVFGDPGIEPLERDYPGPVM